MNNSELEQAAQPASTHVIRPRAVKSPIPLSDNQLQYWDFLCAHGGPIAPRLRAAALRMVGRLDVGLLRESIQFVQQRHESLRIQIVSTDSVPIQHIRPASSWKLNIEDLSGLPALATEPEGTRLAQEFFEQQVPVTTSSLFDAALLKVASTEHVLLLALGHMAGDGASCAILTKEVLEAYGKLSDGTGLNSHPLPLQYGDYAVWQEQTRSSRQNEHHAYWHARMARAAQIEIPLDFKEPSAADLSDATLTLPFGKTLSDRLRLLAQHEDVLLPIIILTTYISVLSRFCGQTDWSMPFVSNGRHGHPELRDMIGFFAKVLFFRVDLSDSPTPIETLHRVQAEFVSATAHQDYVLPFPEGLTVGPMFNWGALVAHSRRWTTSRPQSKITHLRILQFPLAENYPGALVPFFSDTPAGVVATIKYDPHRITRNTIEQLGQEFRTVAEQMLTWRIIHPQKNRPPAIE